MESGQQSKGIIILSLLGTGETASLVLCPVLGPLVQEGGGYFGDGSVKDYCHGLLGHWPPKRVGLIGFDKEEVKGHPVEAYA